MTLCIIFTETEAEAVRGPTAPGAALEPALLADGTTYVLPAEVLADPAHAERHDLLATFPVRDVADDEWPLPEFPA